MNKTLIFRKIGGIIAEITEQYQYLSGDPENINPLELELFIANSHFLSEHLAILKKLDASVEPARISAPNSPNQSPPVSTKTYSLPTTSESDSDSIALEPSTLNQADEIRGLPEGTNLETWEPIAASQVSFSSTVIIDDIPQLLSQDESPANVSQVLEAPALELPEVAHLEIKSAEQPVVADEIKSAKEEPVEAEPIIDVGEPVKPTEYVKPSKPVEVEEIVNERSPVNADEYHHEADNNSLAAERVPTLNEILSAAKNKESAISNKNLGEERDLKSMIKLNDKLMFVRDLFNGYSLAYSEAIDLINRFDNLQSADNFLKHNYADKNRWSEKQNSVDQFYEVLKRRFS